MNPLPPPTLRTVEDEPPNFWQRRGRRGKAGVVAGGMLAVLVLLGAVIPAEEADDVDAASPPLVTGVPSTSEAPVSTSPVDEVDAPATSGAPVTVAATAAPTTTAVPPLAIGRVIDGDTVEMTDGSVIRLIGIDSPERGDCGFDEAADTLNLILYGQAVTLVPGARDDIDRYGRLLRYIDLADGTDVNLAMIESGQAIARYDSRDGYGRHTREDAYVAADAASQPFCSVPVVTTTTTTSVPAPAPPAGRPFVQQPPAVQQPPVVQAPPVVQPPPANVYYQNCDAVRAAGAAPIYPGDPGFQSKFDRDNDGVGCE